MPLSTGTGALGPAHSMRYQSTRKGNTPRAIHAPLRDVRHERASISPVIVFIERSKIDLVVAFGGADSGSSREEIRSRGGGRGVRSSHMGARIASVKEKLKMAPERTPPSYYASSAKNWEFSIVCLFHFL